MINEILWEVLETGPRSGEQVSLTLHTRQLASAMTHCNGGDGKVGSSNINFPSNGHQVFSLPSLQSVFVFQTSCPSENSTLEAVELFL